MYSATKIVPGEFAHDQWRSFYGLRKELRSRYDDPFTPQSMEQFISSSAFAIESGGFTVFVIKHNDEMVGYLRYWMMSPEHAAVQNNMVLTIIKEEFFAPELELLLVRTLRDLMEEKCHPKCLWRSAQPQTLGLVRRVGDAASNATHLFKLDPHLVPAELIDEWLAAVNPEERGMRLEFHQYIPDHLMNEAAELANEVVNDMKRDDMVMRFHVDVRALRNNIETAKRSCAPVYYYFLFDRKGKMIAISAITIADAMPSVADQRITGVKREYRGLGLGKWMKAKMMQKIKEEFPLVRTIRTECFVANAPMIAINKSLGYELYRTDYDYYVTPESLSSFLRGNGG